MKYNWRKILIDSALGRLIGTLIEDGFRVELSDQDGGGLYLYAYPDNGNCPKTGAEYWIRLEPSNSPESFIVDYTTNLESVIRSVFDFAESFVND